MAIILQPERELALHRGVSVYIRTLYTMNGITQRIMEGINRLDLTCGRKIDLIVLHCSATPEGRDVSAADIRRWHMHDRKFADIGYHFVVRLDGTVEAGRPLSMAGAHCLGYNKRSIGICYVGGADGELRSKDTRTPAQREALDLLVGKLRERYPEATVRKHRELASTDCPGF